MDTYNSKCSGINKETFPWQEVMRESLEAGANVTFDEIFLRIFNGSIDPECIFMKHARKQPLSAVKQLTLVLSSIAVVANLLSLLAIYNIKKKLNANLRLIVSLCAADLLVALCFLVLSSDNRLSQKGSTSYSITCLGIVLRSVRNGIHIATLLNLLGLALDHYYAIVHTLHYRVVMNTQRVTWMIIIMWGLSFLLSFTDLYIPSAVFDHCKERDLSLCDWAECTVYNSELIVFVVTIITFILLLYFYISIFVTLRRHNSVLVRHRLIMQKKKQGTITTILILGTFVVFWLPYCLFEMTVNAMTVTNVDRDKMMTLLQVYIKINFYLYDIQLLNSVCDPLIYAWRMRDVQRGYQRILRIVTCYKYHIRQAIPTHSRKNSIDSMTQIKALTIRKRPKVPLCYQGSHLSEESTNQSFPTTSTTLKKEVLHKQVSNDLHFSTLDLRRISENPEGDNEESLIDAGNSATELATQYHPEHDMNSTTDNDEVTYTDWLKLKNTSGSELISCNSSNDNNTCHKLNHISSSSSDPNLCSIPLFNDHESSSLSLPVIQGFTVICRSHTGSELSANLPYRNCQPMKYNKCRTMRDKSSSLSVPHGLVLNSDIQNTISQNHNTSLPSFAQNHSGRTFWAVPDKSKKPQSLGTIQYNGQHSSNNHLKYGGAGYNSLTCHNVYTSCSADVGISMEHKNTTLQCNSDINISMTQHNAFGYYKRDDPDVPLTHHHIKLHCNSDNIIPAVHLKANTHSDTGISMTHENHTVICNRHMDIPMVEDSINSYCDSDTDSEDSSISLTSIDSEEVIQRQHPLNEQCICPLLHSTATNSDQLECDHGDSQETVCSPVLSQGDKQQNVIQNNRTKHTHKYKQKWLTSKEKVLSHILNNKRAIKDATLI